MSNQAPDTYYLVPMIERVRSTTGALPERATFDAGFWAPSASGRSAQWTAAGPNELSGPLDATQHGAFTYFAIGALRGWADGELSGTRDGKITAEEANAYVQRALRGADVRDQRPVWTGDPEWVLVDGATEVGPTF